MRYCYVFIEVINKPACRNVSLRYSLQCIRVICGTINDREVVRGPCINYECSRRRWERKSSRERVWKKSEKEIWISWRIDEWGKMYTPSSLTSSRTFPFAFFLAFCTGYIYFVLFRHELTAIPIVAEEEVVEFSELQENNMKWPKVKKKRKKLNYWKSYR